MHKIARSRTFFLPHIRIILWSTARTLPRKTCTLCIPDQSIDCMGTTGITYHWRSAYQEDSLYIYFKPPRRINRICSFRIALFISWSIWVRNNRCKQSLWNISCQGTRTASTLGWISSHIRISCTLLSRYSSIHLSGKFDISAHPSMVCHLDTWCIFSDANHRAYLAGSLHKLSVKN